MLVKLIIITKKQKFLKQEDVFRETTKKHI